MTNYEQLLKIPVCKPYLWKNEVKYVNEALRGGWISSKGSFLDEFEKKFAAYTNRAYATSVSNGTNSLHLALDILNIGAGDEIIVPDFTMMAPVFAIVQRQAVPVFVDVDDSWNIDVRLIEDKISPVTKAILAVHNYGHPADLVSIKELCDKHDLLLIEDCSEVIGAEVNGRIVGSWSHVSCYSFYANKIITTGEGGMITTNSIELFKKAKSKKNMSFGEGESRFEHTSLGYNYRMTNLQAAIGLAQLEYVEEAIQRKVEIARTYEFHLSSIRGLVMPPCARWAKNVYWVFGMLVTEEFGCSRNDLQSFLAANGIETRRFFTPAHLQPCLNVQLDSGDFPVSSYLHANGIYLPSFVDISNAQIEAICSLICDVQKIHDYG